MTRHRVRSIVLLLVMLSILDIQMVQGLPRYRFANLLSNRGGAAASAANKRTAGKQQPPNNQNRFVQRLVAGGGSRAIAQMVLYPVDALRTLAQTRDGRTLADVGMSALVWGSFTTSSFALIMGALQFSIFGACKERCGPLLASALGAAGSCVVSVPQEVIKQRLVTGIYPSFRTAVSSIARNEGIFGFYSAWKPTMARNVPFVVITFTAQDWIKSYLLSKQSNGPTKSPQKKDLTLLENSLVGMVAAMAACVLTNPMDVIKTQMITQAASVQQPYTSALDCFVTILKTDGPKTFYAGFKQRSTYMCLLWGITFALNGRFTQLVKKSQE